MTKLIKIEGCETDRETALALQAALVSLYQEVVEYTRENPEYTGDELDESDGIGPNRMARRFMGLADNVPDEILDHLEKRFGQVFCDE